MTDLDLYSELLEEDSGNAACSSQPKSLLEQVCLLQSKCAELETELETLSAHLNRSETHRFQLISLNDRILDNFARLGLACRREIHKMKMRIQWLCTKANVPQAKFIEVAQTHSNPPAKVLNPETPLMYSHIVQFLHSFHQPEQDTKVASTETPPVPSTDLCLSQVLAAHLKHDKRCQLRPTRRTLLSNTQSISSLSTEGSHSSRSRSSSSSGSSSSSSSTSQNAFRKSDIDKSKRIVSEKDRYPVPAQHLSRKPPHSGLNQRPAHPPLAGRQDVPKRSAVAKTDMNSRPSDSTQRVGKDLQHRRDVRRGSEASRADPRPNKSSTSRGRPDNSSGRFSDRSRTKESESARYNKRTERTSRRDEPHSRGDHSLETDSRAKPLINPSVNHRVADRKPPNSVSTHAEAHHLTVTETHHASPDTANTKQWKETDDVLRNPTCEPTVPIANHDEINGSDLDKAHCTVYTKRLLSRLKESDHPTAVASPTPPGSLEEHSNATQNLMPEANVTQDLVDSCYHDQVTPDHTQGASSLAACTLDSAEIPTFVNVLSTSEGALHPEAVSEVSCSPYLSPSHALSTRSEMPLSADVTDHQCMVIGGDATVPSVASEVELVSTEPDQRTWSSCDEQDVGRGSPSTINQHHSKSPEDDSPDESSSPDEEGEVGDDLDDEDEADDRLNGPIGTLLPYGKRRRPRSPRRVGSKASRTSDGSGSVKSAHKRRNMSTFGSPPVSDNVTKGGSVRGTAGAENSRSRQTTHDSKSSSFGHDTASDVSRHQIPLSPREARRYRESSRLMSPPRSASVKQSESGSSEKPPRVSGRQSSFELKQKGLRYDRSRSPSHSASSARPSSSVRNYESRCSDFGRLNRKSVCSTRPDRRSPPHSHGISNTRRPPRPRADSGRDARFRRSRPLSPTGCTNRPPLVHPHHSSVRPKMGGGFQRRHF